jgi:hypothetical protein
MQEGLISEQASGDSTLVVRVYVQSSTPVVGIAITCTRSTVPFVNEAPWLLASRKFSTQIPNRVNGN